MKGDDGRRAVPSGANVSRTTEWLRSVAAAASSGARCAVDTKLDVCAPTDTFAAGTAAAGAAGAASAHRKSSTASVPVAAPPSLVR